MTTDEKLDLVKQVGEEIITEEELKKLLEKDEQLIAYDGFEPSGQMHIAQGILRAININKMTKAGIKFKMLVADWHAMANKKMGGDLEKIQIVGKYFIEVWKACGMDMENVEFVWASDLIKDSNYWKLVLQIAGTNSIQRFKKTAEIMGRFESENLTLAQLIYPSMQVADIFTLGAQITQLGMDQRKINVLAREIGLQLGFWKPVIVSNHMLLGLQGRGQIDALKALPKRPENLTPEMVKRAIKQKKTSTNYSSAVINTALEMLKMSKSQPESAIFMTDSNEEVERKINKVYCPAGEVEDNPILEYCRYIIFELVDKVTISNAKSGETKEFDSYSQLAKEYESKKIHPQDLKTAVIKYLDDLLQPVRKHFEQNPYARTLLEKVKSYQITR